MMDVDILTSTAVSLLFMINVNHHISCDAFSFLRLLPLTWMLLSHVGSLAGDC